MPQDLIILKSFFVFKMKNKAIIVRLCGFDFTNQSNQRRASASAGCCSVIHPMLAYEYDRTAESQRAAYVGRRGGAMPPCTSCSQKVVKQTHNRPVSMYEILNKNKNNN